MPQQEVVGGSEAVLQPTTKSLLLAPPVPTQPLQGRLVVAPSMSQCARASEKKVLKIVLIILLMLSLNFTSTSFRLVTAV